MKRTRVRTQWCCAPLLALGLAACAGSQAPSRSSSFESLWARYAEMPEPRALAIAGDPNTTRWVGSAASGHASEAEAEQQALAGCKKQRASRRLQVPCRLYAIGDFVIWD
jgi:hypothetical protein